MWLGAHPFFSGELVREGGGKDDPNCASCDAETHCHGEAKGRRERGHSLGTALRTQNIHVAQRARENAQPFQGATRCLLSLMLAAMPGARGQRRLARPSTGSPGAAHSSTDLGQNCIAEGTPTRFLEPQHKAQLPGTSPEFKTLLVRCMNED